VVKALASFMLLAAAMPALAVQAYRIEPVTAALGEPITLTLTAQPGRLEKLDLSPVAMDFEINGRTLGGDGREETLVLTLYPLHKGRIALPNLGLPGRPPVVAITEHSNTTPQVHFYVETTPGTYHVRQSVRLTIEACDDGSLLWQRPQLATREGVFMRPLNEEQVDVERGGERCTAHRWHWSVLPTVAGVTVLPLPMLQASKFGQRLRFPPPEARLAALPVPGWLPSDVAIGRPEISVAHLPAQWPVKRPLAWKIGINGDYSADALKNLLRLQLENESQFANYAPSVKELVSESAVPRYAITLYPLFQKPGEARLPDLVLPWYDPATESLQQLRLSGSRLQVFDPSRQRLISGLLVMAALVTAFSFGCLLWRTLGWRLRRHRALAGLKHVTNIADLVRQLCAFSLHAETLPAATLGEWQQRMLLETETKGLAELVMTVELTRYGTVEKELDRLLEDTRNCLASSRPKSLRTWRH
jgi:hypothetical protein